MITIYVYYTTNGSLDRYISTMISVEFSESCLSETLSPSADISSKRLHKIDLSCLLHWAVAGHDG